MSMFVIKRTSDGLYVALPGLKSSYVKNLQYARTFPTREQAVREVCPDNERIVSIEEEMIGHV